MPEPQSEQPKITPAQEKEAKTRVILGEKSPAKDTAVQNRIDKLSENLAGQGPRSMLESIRDARREASADTAEDNKALNEKAKNVAESNIGWDVDEKGEKSLDAGEKARLKDVSERAKDVTDYISKDFDVLKPGQRARILEDVSRMVRSVPELKNCLDGLPDKGRSTIDNLARNPEFRAKVRGVFDGKLDESFVSNESLKQDIMDANENLKKTNLEREQKEKDLLNISRDITANDIELSKFDLNGGADGGKGEKLLRLEELRNDAPENQAEVEKRQSEITNISSNIDALRQEMVDSVAKGAYVDNWEEINKLIEKRAVLNEEKSGFEEKLEDLNKLEKAQEVLKENKQKLAEEKEKLTNEYEEAMADEREKNAAITAIKDDKAAGEQKFIDGINNTFKDAMGEYIEEKAEQVEDESERLDNENQATDEFGKKLRKGLNDRWSKDKIIKEGAWPIPGRKTRESKVPDIDKINGDFGKLLKEGPDAVLKNILVENCGLTAIDADAKMQDKAFVDGEGKKIVDQLLSKKFQTGQITGAEAAYIANADWGQGAIQRAIEKNKEIQSAFKTLSEKGVLKGSTPQEWVKEIAKSNKTNSSILALLFGALLLPVLGAKALSDSLKESYNSAAAL